MTAAFTGGTPSARSPHERELLERVAVRRDEVVAHADRPGDLGDGEGAVRVEREPVWRAEVPRTAGIGGAPGLLPRTLVAQACDDPAPLVADRHAAPGGTPRPAPAERPG